ncbi:MAG TPA: phosphohydrolase [Selenomonas sp.]|nr:response regulator [Selenomonadaceae bacterium]HCB92453.1 phosphohydrolase [Selenomonas sp.]
MLDFEYGVTPKILAVDDAELNLVVLQRIIGDGADLTCVDSGQAALDYLSKHTVDLVLLDINMPGMGGFEVLARMKSQPELKDIPVIILTAEVAPETEMEGFTAGAVDFVKKPFIPKVVLLRIKRVLEYEHLQKNLMYEVKRQTRLAEERLRTSERLFEETVIALARAIDAKDKYTSGHSQRVAGYSREIAKRAGKSEDEQKAIYYMGLLHDVGKIGIPLEIINKTSGLTDEEYKTIKTHTVIGSGILESIEQFPELLIGARSHHERYDGKGYPDGLMGNAIPEAARIIAVADAYDAMTSKRSYRSILSQATVRAEIERGRGRQFDPHFANIMMKMMDEDVEFRLRGTEAPTAEYWKNLIKGESSLMNQKKEKLMDIELGLQYSGGQEALFKELLKVFCKMKADKWPAMRKAYANGDWDSYETFANTMKSTSLTVGGRRLSEAAKKMESACKAYIAPAFGEGNKADSLKYIQDNHESLMKLCDDFIAEAEEWLNEEISKD